MRTVLLIYPRFPASISLNIPLNLLHLGTYLQSQRFAVRIIDCTMEEDPLRKVAEGLDDIAGVGISCMTTQLPHALRIAELVKSRRPQTPVIFGGVHPTLYPLQVVQDAHVDYCVISEGEVSLTLLLRALENGMHKEIERIPGIAFKDERGEPRVNQPLEPFEYAHMPPFDYGLIAPGVIDAYRRSNTYFPLLTSRGCPYRCAFCINVVTRNTRWRAFGAERCVSEIERIRSLGFSKIWFWDENFFTDKRRLQSILTLIESKDLRIDAWSEGRANYFKEGYLDDVLLSRLKGCGFTRFGLGIESGSQRILDYLQKDITVDEVKAAARACARAGIRLTCSFMIGVPGETRQDMSQTLDLMGEIVRITGTAGISGPILYRPYPGSKLYTECLKKGWQEPRDNAAWSRKIEDDFSRVPDPHRLPWIRDPYFTNFAHFYTYTVSVPFLGIYRLFCDFCRMTKQKWYFRYPGAVVLLLLASLGKMRHRLGLYRFLFEKRLFSKYHPNLDY